MYRDTLGNRMKEFYEDRSKTYLLRKTPVIIRVDGKSFHTFCKRFNRPFDECLNCMLAKTMQHLCTEIQGSVFAERHSDEISILVIDRSPITTEIDSTEAYFDYSVQKLCSVAASTATAKFCKEMMKYKCCSKYEGKQVLEIEDNWPTFDCRCFNIPMHEITNYFWWRMLDAKRNSISMLAQSVFSNKELHGKNCDEMQEMIFQKTGTNWANLPQVQKIGNICYKKTDCKQVEISPLTHGYVEKKSWQIDGSPSNVTDLRKIIDDILKPFKDI